MSKSLISAYSRAKQSGNFIFQSQGATVFPPDLPNFQDMTIPGENWWDGYDLVKVDLSNNLIDTIPEDIGLQQYIQHMNLNTNKLRTIPNSLFSIPSLKFLDISYNSIKILPESLGLAISLCELKATGNQIESVPQSIGDLESLEVLDLKAN